ncbi:MAG: hypothetical protein V2A73_10480 [Pseudomonadota bacterium]
MLRLTTIIGLLACLSSCYSTYLIHPSELPKLNGSYVATIGSVHTPGTYIAPSSVGGGYTAGTYRPGTTTPITQASVRHFITPEGTTLEVKGELDAAVETATGQRYEFRHPIIVENTEDSVTIRGKDSMVQLRLDEIQRAEVTAHDAQKSILAGIGVTTVVSIAILCIFVPH